MSYAIPKYKNGTEVAFLDEDGYPNIGTIQSAEVTEVSKFLPHGVVRYNILDMFYGKMFLHTRQEFVRPVEEYAKIFEEHIKIKREKFFKKASISQIQTMFLKNW